MASKVRCGPPHTVKEEGGEQGWHLSGNKNTKQTWPQQQQNKDLNPPFWKKRIIKECVPVPAMSTSENTYNPCWCSCRATEWHIYISQFRDVSQDVHFFLGTFSWMTGWSFCQIICTSGCVCVCTRFQLSNKNAERHYYCHTQRCFFCST